MQCKFSVEMQLMCSIALHSGCVFNAYDKAKMYSIAQRIEGLSCIPQPAMSLEALLIRFTFMSFTSGFAAKLPLTHYMAHKLQQVPAALFMPCSKDTHNDSKLGRSAFQQNV